jgi:hypothetical protein
LEQLELLVQWQDLVGCFPIILHGFWVSCGFVHIFLGLSSYFIYVCSFLGFLLGMSYLLFLSSVISFSNKSLFDKKIEDECSYSS